jgi:hypothetical protein
LHHHLAPKHGNPLGCLLEADEGTPPVGRSGTAVGQLAFRLGGAEQGAEAVEEGGCDLLWRLLLGSGGALRARSGPEEADWASGLVL